MDKSKLLIFDWLKLMRIHQWSKNILIFLPLIAIKKFEKIVIIENLILIILFSFFVSSSYIINDILDIKADRQHKDKRYRPLASKKISIKNAIIFSILLFSSALTLTYFYLSIDIVLFFLFYFFISIFYSKFFKKIQILDLFILTFFYLFRIYVGGHYNEIEISNWLLFFAFFFFLTIGITKRITELESQKISRNYKIKDSPYLKILSTTSAFSSILILILYIQSNNFLIYYNENKLFFLVPIIILFWLLRLIYLSINNKISHDPVVFVIKDKLTYILFFICSIILY